jgi:hypothetical protein
MYSINFFFPMGALGWRVALAQGLAGLTPGPALSDLILDLDCFNKTLRMSEVNWKDQHTVDIS